MAIGETKKCLFCEKIVRESQLSQHLSSFHAIDPNAYAQILEEGNVVPRPQQLEREDGTTPVRAVGKVCRIMTELRDADVTEERKIRRAETERGMAGMAVAEMDAESWTEQCVWECKACEFRCRSSSKARAHCIEEHGEKAEAEFEISARTMFLCPQCDKEVLWVNEEIIHHIEAGHSLGKSAFFEMHKEYITNRGAARRDPSPMKEQGVFVPTLSANNRQAGEEDRDVDKRKAEDLVATTNAENEDGNRTKSQQRQEMDYDHSGPSVILPSPEQLPPPSPGSMTIIAEITAESTASAAAPAPSAARLEPPSELNNADPQSPRVPSPAAASSAENTQAVNSSAPRSDYGLLRDAVPNGPTKWFDQCLFECTKCGKRQYPIAAMKTHCRQTHGDPTCQKKVAGAIYRCLFSNCKKELPCDRISIECHIRSGQHKLRNMREYDAMFTVDQHMAAVTRLPDEATATTAPAQNAAPSPLRVPLLPKSAPSASAGNEGGKGGCAPTDQAVVKIVALTSSSLQSRTEVVKPAASAGESVNPKNGRERRAEAEVVKPVRPSLRGESEDTAASEAVLDQLSSTQAEVVADVEECLATLGETVSAKERLAETRPPSAPADGPDRRRPTSRSSEGRVKVIKVAMNDKTVHAGEGAHWMDKCEFTCRDCKMTVGRRQQMQLHVNRSDLCTQRSYDTSRKVYHRCRVCDRDILNESTSIVSHLSKKHDMKIAHYSEQFMGQRDNSGGGGGGARQSSFSLKRKMRPATVKRGVVKVLKEEVGDGPSKSAWYNRPGRSDVHVCRMCRWRVAFDEEALVHHFRRAHGMTMEDYTTFFMKHEDEKNTKKCPICESPIPREAIEDHAINVHRMPKETFAQLARSLSKSRTSSGAHLNEI